MSSESIKHFINARINESIEEMSDLLKAYYAYKQNLTGNKRSEEHTSELQSH